MKLLRKWETFTSSERRGVLILFIIILVFQAVYFTMDFWNVKHSSGLITSRTMAFQHRIDSLKQVKIQEDKPKIYPFNPNYLTDYRAYALGISTEEFDRLKTYRMQEKFVNSPREFQQVTRVSDSLLRVIEPYFKFPDWVKNKKEETGTKSVESNFTPKSKTATTSKTQTKTDLNTATKEQLMEINGIGDKLSDRILTYRNKLQGYSFDEQLYEVWYLDKEVADRVLQKFTVLSKPNIEKINVNTADFKVVMKLPYMDYELTKKIFNYKNAAGKITSMEALKKIEGFPVDKFERISLYLKAE